MSTIALPNISLDLSEAINCPIIFFSSCNTWLGWSLWNYDVREKPLTVNVLRKTANVLCHRNRNQTDYVRCKIPGPHVKVQFK